MKKFDQLPKTIKKTVRYIKQDAKVEDLELIKAILEHAIEGRRKEKKSYALKETSLHYKSM